MSNETLSKAVPVKKDSSPSSEVPSLIQLLRKDRELYDLFHLIRAYDLRERAVDLLESRMSRS